MPPTEPTLSSDELFRRRLDNLIDLNHPLARLARTVDWSGLDARLCQLYCASNGRAGLPVRLMAGLAYLKHSYNLSDRELVARWVENPYWQYFCGQEYFTHELPCDASQLTRWRQRLQEAGAGELLAELLRCGLVLKQLTPAQLESVIVDTTAQTKAVRYPTDARLYERSLQHLAKLARDHGVKLRRTYLRKLPSLMRQLSGYHAAKQHRRAARVVKGLRTKLGRVLRELGRKGVAVPAVYEKIHRQQRHDQHKIYSVHEPEVSCIAKGKTHPRYEFGSKTALVCTERGNWMLGAKVFAGNPYDGHTLAASLAAVPQLVRERLRRALVDLGYRKHDEEQIAVQVVQRSRKNLSNKDQARWRRRNAIEPLIGHGKRGFRLERNQLKGLAGDHLNALLAITGMNLRKLLRGLLAWLDHWLLFGRCWHSPLPTLAGY